MRPGLDADRVTVLVVPRSEASGGAERLEIAQLESVSVKEELDVQGQARMPA